MRIEKIYLKEETHLYSIIEIKGTKAIKIDQELDVISKSSMECCIKMVAVNLECDLLY